MLDSGYFQDSNSGYWNKHCPDMLCYSKHKLQVNIFIQISKWQNEFNDLVNCTVSFLYTPTILNNNHCDSPLPSVIISLTQ